MLFRRLILRHAPLFCFVCGLLRCLAFFFLVVDEGLGFFSVCLYALFVFSNGNLSQFGLFLDNTVNFGFGLFDGPCGGFRCRGNPLKIRSDTLRRLCRAAVYLDIETLDFAELFVDRLDRGFKACFVRLDSELDYCHLFIASISQ